MVSPKHPLTQSEQETVVSSEDKVTWDQHHHMAIRQPGPINPPIQHTGHSEPSKLVAIGFRNPTLHVDNKPSELVSIRNQSLVKSEYEVYVMCPLQSLNDTLTKSELV